MTGLKKVNWMFVLFMVSGVGFAVTMWHLAWIWPRTDIVQTYFVYFSAIISSLVFLYFLLSEIYEHVNKGKAVLVEKEKK